MKKFLMASIMSCAFTYVSAQDPQISGANITPAPVQKTGDAITLSLTFRNASDTEILNPDPDFDMTMITFSTGKYKPNFVGGDRSLPVVTGNGSAYFTWDAACNGTCALDGSSDGTDIWVITGRQSSVIPANFNGQIALPGIVTAESTEEEAISFSGTGFISNVIPGAGGDVDNSPESNVAYLYTYTDATLPVTLLSFSGSKEGSMANLLWSTTMETNSDRFEVERSIDGKKWGVIGSVRSHGESAVSGNYNFSDSQPVNGENLYRLKMVDLDKSFAYSKIVALRFEGIEDGLSVYPNPSAGSFRIRDYATVQQIRITDLSGRTVHEQRIDATGSSFTGEVDAKSLPNGIYLIGITGRDGILTTKKLLITK